MATAAAQRKWRQKNQFTKRQLNVMARKNIHEFLEEFAGEFQLNGKGEAVSFSAFVTKTLMQQAEFNGEADRLLMLITEAFRKDRDLFQP